MMGSWWENKILITNLNKLLISLKKINKEYLLELKYYLCILMDITMSKWNLHFTIDIALNIHLMILKGYFLIKFIAKHTFLHDSATIFECMLSYSISQYHSSFLTIALTKYVKYKYSKFKILSVTHIEWSCLMLLAYLIPF